MKAKRVVPFIIFAALATLILFSCQSKEVTSAKVYIQQDNWAKAKEQLLMAVDLYPNDPEAHYLLGEAYAKEGEWENMNESFDKSLKIGPRFEPQIKNTIEKNWVTTFNSGVSKINTNDLEAAIGKFKECLLINPERVEGYKNLAVSYMRTDNYEEAKNVYKQYLAIDPKDLEIIQQLAQVHFELKEYNDVVELEKRVLEIEPENVDAIVNLALAYDFLGESDMAIETYEKALSKNPNEKDLLFNLGRLYYMRDNYEKAIENFNRVIEQDPEDFDSNLNVGNALLTMADNERKRLLEKENNGETVTAAERENLKNFYCKALPYLEKAASLKDDNPNVWNNLGVAAINCGEKEKGEAAFKKAEELNK
jgi:tetratricopeptide (TPR) repeat protein